MFSVRVSKTFATRPQMICRPKRLMVKADAGVVPEMLDVLTNYVCPVIHKCAGIYIGTEEHQISVLSKLHAIADHYDIRNAEEHVVRALLIDDDVLAVKIADATDVYHQSVDYVREMISKLPSVSHHSNV
jgi:hypothetical protein